MLHKWFHRLAGSSMVLVGLLQQLQVIDFTTFLETQNAAYCAAGLAIVIAAMEFLPVLDEWIEGSREPKGASEASCDVAP
jgi:hypothetical protein